MDTYSDHSFQNPVTRVKKLDSHLVDKIAAGEVVERYSQIIKELVENSIDAGASSIKVEVGRDLSWLLIDDDGHGVQREDLPLIFDRHSTSKIERHEDLMSLDSFGFRGEALAAIGSVSHVKIRTKSDAEEESSQMELKFGVKSSVEEGSRTKGSEILIQSLFENVPARKKFLKSTRYEISQVKKTITSFALIHPEIEFKFMIEGAIKDYFQRAVSLEERYEQVFKKKIYRVPLIDHELLDSRSFILLEEPSFESKTSSSLWTYAQGRWVQDRTLIAACRDGLSTYLMHGAFPQGVIHFAANRGFIDVNVHPMKTQVRYEDSSLVYKLVRNSVALWAEKSLWLDSKLASNPVVESSPMVRENTEEYTSKPQEQFIAKEFEKVQFKNNISSVNFESVEKSSQLNSTVQEGNEPLWGSLQVVGQVDLTYLLTQSDSELIVIDQHAAHERVVYEKLYRSWKENKNLETQSLLIPLHISLSEQNCISLLNHSGDLEKIGIKVEAAGPSSLVLSEYPGFLSERALVVALEKFSGEIHEKGGGTSVEDLIKLFFATVSCHSVIRAGKSMNNQEIQLLLDEMDIYRSSYCPHGRPVYVSIPFEKLHRDFGRLG